MSLIFAIETSCDDTACAVIQGHGEILSNVVFSQIKEHEPYGGIVPEIGSRAHIEQIHAVTQKAFYEAGCKPNDLSAVAATFAPGLMGPLLVGAQFAKGMAVGLNIPLIPVHHIVGHILSGYGEEKFFKPPFLALIVSGGHSSIYECNDAYEMTSVGETLDDAAGEAFDKIGRMLGISYPAGKEIDALAQGGNKNKFSFTIPMKNEAHFNFSFSGIKTKALLHIKNSEKFSKSLTKDFCASLQEVICQSLVKRTIRAAKHFGHSKIVLGGGVAANSRLRELMAQMCAKESIELFLPKRHMCTDNAAMIGRAASILWQQKKFASLDCDVKATMNVSMCNSFYNAAHN